MHLKKVHPLIGIFLFPFLLSGCFYSGLYNPDIQQGNIMEEAGIAKLEKGMTLREVKKILGDPVLTQTVLQSTDKDENTPLLENESDIAKVEYVYFYQPKYDKTIRKRVSLSFEDEKLIELYISN